MCIFFIASSLSISQSVLYGDVLCLTLVTILHWGIPPSLSSLDLLHIFSLFDLFLDLFKSSYQGIPPLTLFYWGIPPSLRLSHLMMISWLLDPFFNLYELSPRASPYLQFVWDIPFPLACLGHHPTDSLFMALPFFSSVCLGHSPTISLFRALPIFFSLFRASPYCHLVQGIPLLSSCLGHPPTVNLFRAFPYRQFVQGIPLLSVLTTVDQTSMGSFQFSPPQIFVCGL